MAGEGIASTTRLAKVTLAHWVKRLTDNAYKNNVALKVLKEKGLIESGVHGGQLRWPFRYTKFGLDPYIDGAQRTFARTQIEENAVLRWGGYEVKELITEFEKDQHGGKEAIVEVLKKRTKFMEEDANERLSGQIYVDGNLAANVTNRTWHGLESFMSWTAQTATDKLATTLNDTYGGQSYTGFNANAAVTDPEYGAWSPVIVNTNRTVAAATNAWADYADEYLRAGIIEACYGKDSKSMLDLILMTKDAYTSTLNLLDDKEQLNFNRGSDVGKASFGFPVHNGFEIDGVVCTWDIGLPATDVNSDTVHAYGLNTDRMKLKLLGPKTKMLWRLDMNYDPFQAADLLRIFVSGNLCFESPRYFAKFADIS